MGPLAHKIIIERVKHMQRWQAHKAHCKGPTKKVKDTPTWELTTKESGATKLVKPPE